MDIRDCSGTGWASFPVVCTVTPQAAVQRYWLAMVRSGLRCGSCTCRYSLFDLFGVPFLHPLDSSSLVLFSNGRADSAPGVRPSACGCYSVCSDESIF